MQINVHVIGNLVIIYAFLFMLQEFLLEIQCLLANVHANASSFVKLRQAGLFSFRRILKIDVKVIVAEIAHR